MQEKASLTNSALTTWSAIIFKTFGFLAVVYVIIYVTTLRLNDFRSVTDSLPAGYISAAERARDLDCLTRNIYWEAANESFEGKVGVAQVTMNRVKSDKFANSVCGVVYQKNVFYEKVVCQFSWYCENVSRVRPIHPVLWRECEEVAKKVLLENFGLPSLKSALFYHADYVNPKWNLPKITQIGRHIFYGQKSTTR